MDSKSNPPSTASTPSTAPSSTAQIIAQGVPVQMPQADTKVALEKYRVDYKDCGDFSVTVINGGVY